MKKQNSQLSTLIGRGPRTRPPLPASAPRAEEATAPAPTAAVPTSASSARSIAERSHSGELMPAADHRVVSIRLTDIAPDEAQPRQREHYTDRDKKERQREIDEMVQTIQRDGLLHPITVSINPKGLPRFSIIAGETRYWAYKALGRETIPGIVKTLDEHQRLVLQFAENHYRSNLTPIELCEALDRMRLALARGAGKTDALRWEELPTYLPNISRSQCQVARRLVKLPDSVKDRLRGRHMPALHMIRRAVAGVKEDDVPTMTRCVEELIARTDRLLEDPGSSSDRTAAARSARTRGVLKRALATFTVKEKESDAGIDVTCLAEFPRHQWEAMRKDPVAKAHAEADALRRVAHRCTAMADELDATSGKP